MFRTPGRARAPPGRAPVPSRSRSVRGVVASRLWSSSTVLEVAEPGGLVTTVEAAGVRAPAWRGGFGRLWSAAVVSRFGDALRTAALPLLAVRLTDDPLVIASVTACGYLPWLLFGLLGGAVADRVDQRRAMSGRRHRTRRAGGLLRPRRRARPCHDRPADRARLRPDHPPDAARQRVHGPAALPGRQRDPGQRQCQTDDRPAARRRLPGRALRAAAAHPRGRRAVRGRRGHLSAGRRPRGLPADPGARAGSPARRGQPACRAEVAEGVRTLWHDRVLRAGAARPHCCGASAWAP